MTRRSVSRGLAAASVVLTGLLPVACGSSGRSGLSPVERTQLLGMIDQARSAAAAGNPAGATTSLTEMRSTVAQLRTAGVLDPAKAGQMQTVVAQALSAARAQAAARAAAARAAAPAAPAAQPAPPAPAAPAAPATSGPAAVIVQGAGALKARVDQAVGQGVAKLKGQLAGLEQRLTGQGHGPGPGGGGGD